MVWWRYAVSILIRERDWRLFGAKPFHQPMRIGYKLEHISVTCESKCNIFHSWKCTWQYRLQHGGHFVQPSTCWCYRRSIPIHATNISFKLRRRQMTVMASRVIGQSSVCSTIRSDWQQRNSTGPRHCPVVRGIHRSPWIPRTKGQKRRNVSIWWRHNIKFTFLEITVFQRAHYW